MPEATAARAPLVVVAGNPNTGKTTLFNRLTGLDLKVGNYPGVTVDRHTGKLRLASGPVRLTDVPGTYSLSARSAEEQIAINALCGLPPYEQPDLALLVVDATQLTRNLYLVLQVLELEVPTVVALNMTDMLDGLGLAVDAPQLAAVLGVPVVPVCTKSGAGLEQLQTTVAAALHDPAGVTPGPRWTSDDEHLRADIAAVAEALPESWVSASPARREALAAWALLSLDDDDELLGAPDDLRSAVAARRAAAQAAGRDIDHALVAGRYAWIDEHAAPAQERTRPERRSWTRRFDDVLLNPLYGFPVFLVVMTLLFQSLFAWADPLIGWIETAFGWLGGRAQEWLPAGILRDFVTDGLIAGVGSVVVFLPQILLLFLFIGVLEASGYMARVAYLMDRVMRLLGLNGRAFVPMLSGFACAIPAIMATRTMERRRDRLMTMMVVPLMTCSARLPVYTLVIATLFPPSRVFGVGVQPLLMVLMYLFGTVIALVAAAVLSRTMLKGPTVPLILELPPSRLPDARSVLRTMWQKGRVFLTEAGTVILVCTIGLWLLLAFPRQAPDAADFAARRAGASEDVAAQVDREEQSSRLRHSYAGRMGHALEPVIRPLGFDWKIGVGLIGAFAAREVFVSTMGVVYGVGEDVDEQSSSLRERIKAEARANGKPVYTPLVGLSLMVFFALACQCLSTLAVVKRETASFKWPLFLFVYMTALAWVASLLTYQGGRLLGFG
jgi:ferrous iron transport protein B